MLGRIVARAVVAMATSFLLVVTLVSPAAAEDPVVSPPELEQPSLVSIPGEPSDPVVIAAPVTPEGDFEGLDVVEQPPTPSRGVAGDDIAPPTPALGDSSLATSFDEATSRLQSQTEFTNTYLNADGSHTTALGGDPLNARNDSGQWVPVSTDLDSNADASWSTDAHPLDPSFGAHADDEGAFSVSRGGYTISFTLQGAEPSTIRVPTNIRDPYADQDTVIYGDALDGVDLQYDVLDSGVKESLILSDVPSVADSVWTWRVDTDGLDMRVGEFGDIEFVD